MEFKTQALNFHALSGDLYCELLDYLYPIANLVNNLSFSCQKSYLRVIMYHQTIETIRSMAISISKKFSKKTGRNLDVFNTKLRIIFTFSKTTDVEFVCEMFGLLIDLLLKLLKSNEYCLHQIIHLVILTLEKFLDS